MVTIATIRVRTAARLRKFVPTALLTPRDAAMLRPPGELFGIEQMFYHSRSPPRPRTTGPP
jgi:hypothetical protein